LCKRDAQLELLETAFALRDDAGDADRLAVDAGRGPRPAPTLARGVVGPLGGSDRVVDIKWEIDDPVRVEFGLDLEGAARTHACSVRSTHRRDASFSGIGAAP
jgi:hypothetical protein